MHCKHKLIKQNVNDKLNIKIYDNRSNIVNISDVFNINQKLEDIYKLFKCSICLYKYE